MLAKTALLCYNNYSDKKRVIICVLKGILDVCFSVKSTHTECCYSNRELLLTTLCFLFCFAYAAALADFSVRYYNLSAASQKCNEERSFCLSIPLFQFLYGEVNYPLNLYKFQPYRFQAHTCYCKKKSLARHSPM